MPYRQDDTTFDTDDAFARLALDTASPRDLFYALTAQGVPPQQAMTAAYARDGDAVRATLQAYGRRAPDASAAAAVQPMSARGASVFPDPPQFPPLTADDAMRRRPGFIPRPDGGDDLGPGYLDPRPEEVQRRSRWAVRDSSRESLGLPQVPTDQFAGVNLTRGADGGYGLDPHYAAQMRHALDTEPYVPSQRERIVRGGKFYAGAAPFGFAGPGSLNFDPSLESNVGSLAPFRRSLDDFQSRDPNRLRRAGNYAGGTASLGPVGLGAYVDDSGYVFPQFYFGTPGYTFEAGHSDDLDSQLDGISIAGGAGKRGVSPSIGVTAGLGRFELPEWAKPLPRRLLKF